MQRRAILTLTAILMLAINPAAFASDYKPLYPGFPEIRDSKAYKKFAVRPTSNLSKILYLVDRFGESKIEILYENQPYLPSFATTVVRWFLARNYKKETPQEWVQKWCSHSVFSNKLIYIKLPNGEFLMAKDVLMKEIEALEEVIRENQQIQIDHASDKALAEVPLAKPNGSSLAQALSGGPKTKLS